MTPFERARTALREWASRLGGALGSRRRDADLEEELRLHLDLAAEDERRTRGHHRRARREPRRFDTARCRQPSKRSAISVACHGSTTWRATSATRRGRLAARRSFPPWCCSRWPSASAPTRPSSASSTASSFARSPIRTRIRARRDLAYRAGRVRHVESLGRPSPLPIDVLHLRGAEPDLRAPRHLVRRLGNRDGRGRARAGQKRVRVGRNAAGARGATATRAMAAAADQAVGAPGRCCLAMATGCAGLAATARLSAGRSPSNRSSARSSASCQKVSAIVDAEPDIIVPFGIDRSRLTLPGFGLQGLGRLKPGVTIEQASADIARLVPIWNRSWPAAPSVDPLIYESWRITPALRPLEQDVVGNVAATLWVLMGTIGIVHVDRWRERRRAGAGQDRGTSAGTRRQGRTRGRARTHRSRAAR